MMKIFTLTLLSAFVCSAWAAQYSSKSTGYNSVRGYFDSFLDKLGIRSYGYNDKYDYPKRDDLITKCANAGDENSHTTLVNGTKCYEIIRVEMSWEDAQRTCESKGAILWEPEIYDGHIYQCFLCEFPALVGTAEGFWVNIRVNQNTGIFTTQSTGLDVSDSPFVCAVDDFSGLCLSFDPDDGFFELETLPCTDLQNFVCEHDIGFGVGLGTGIMHGNEYY